MTTLTRARARTKTPTAAKPTVICVFGTPGAGRSTLAVNVAAELAVTQKSVLLIDADTQNPSLATLLGIPEHPVGLAALARSVRSGTMSISEIQRQSKELEVAKRVFGFIPGMPARHRWAEVTPSAMQSIIQIAKTEYEYVVVDLPPLLGNELERPESPLKRDALTNWLIENADALLVLAEADPISIGRLVNLETSLNRAPANCRIIINRYRTAALGPSAKLQVRDTVQTLMKRKVDHFLPDDPKATDNALARGGTLHSSRAKSPLRKAITKLVRELTARN